MTKVEFKYDIDDEVCIKPFGNESGIITMLGYDEAGPQYYVRAKDLGGWYKEKQIVSYKSIADRVRATDES